MLSLDASRLFWAAIGRAQRHRLLRPAWWAVAGGSLVALAGGGYACHWSWREGDRLRAELTLVEAEQAIGSAASPGERAADFTATLPTGAPIDKLLRETFRTAASSGVSVVSAEPREALAAAPNGLASATLALRLAGPYPGIKIVLAELLARFPGLTVQHLRIQRAAGSTSAQEATVTLQQWLRPTPVALPSPESGS